VTHADVELVALVGGLTRRRCGAWLRLLRARGPVAGFRVERVTRFADGVAWCIRSTDIHPVDAASEAV